MQTQLVASSDLDRDKYPYKMKDLCELTGLDRQTIHFYIQQELVPEGVKTGRNMAYYGPEHVERLNLIRQLQRERFLPLKAIRAVLDGQDEQFSADQKSLLIEVKNRLAGELSAANSPAETMDASALLREHGVTRAELDEMETVGLLSTLNEGTKRLVRSDDAWMIELWGQLKATGVMEVLGVEVKDLAIIEEAMSVLLDREVELLTPRLNDVPPDQLAALVQRVLPLLNTFLTRYHNTKIRNFFAALD